jgi:hypothetical protein
MNSAINADQLLRSLALAIARNQVGAARPTHEVIAGEGMTQIEYDQIAKNPQFQRYVDAYMLELKDNGFSFSAKSKVLAEDLLATAYHMAQDPDTPAAVRTKILENFVEWADLKPKKDASALAGPGFSITINIPSSPNSPSQTIVLEAETPENAQNTPKNPLSQVQIPQLLQKEPILLGEGDEYEYAGDDYL